MMAQKSDKIRPLAAKVLHHSFEWRRPNREGLQVDVRILSLLGRFLAD